MIDFIIAEYNPFHNGHLYQLQQCKNPVIVIQSGDFTQRGAPAILGKYERARIAVENGADLVLELPVLSCLQSAENYARGGVLLALKTNLSGRLVFSAESSEKELLLFFDRLKDKDYKRRKDEYILRGESAAGASEKAYKDLFGTTRLFRSNNLLAVHYLKALENQRRITPFILQRIGNDYNDPDIGTFASATAIRRSVKSGHPDAVKKSLPQNSFRALLKRPQPMPIFDLFRYRLVIEQAPMENITGYEKGMDDLFRKHIEEKDFYRHTVSRRYRKNRINRLISNYLLNIGKKEVDEYYRLKAPYFKVLAAGDKGLELLGELKKSSDLPILTNYRQKKDLGERRKRLYTQDLNASFLAFGKIEDYYGMKIIKTDR